MKNLIRHITLVIIVAAALLTPRWVLAQDSIVPAPTEESQAPAPEGKEKFDAKSFIFGHTGDSYCFHITEIKGEPVCVWLPVIVKCKDGGSWHCFSSFTKNAFGIFLVCAFLLAFFLPAAKKYKKDPMGQPTKYQGLIEWLTYMVLDGIIRPNVPEKKVKKFAPYLLTVFFFIFFANLFGLIPFFPFGANVTGNLSITIVLALLTYFFVNLFGNRHYWKDILWPDVPIFLKALPLMPIIELISTITKPFALMVRLFANILAGHIVIMVLMALIFIIGGMYGAGMGGVMSIVSIFMTALELLVAYIQAYVFTILSSLFIGMAQHEPKHE